MVNILLGIGIRASTLINSAIVHLDMMSGYLKIRHTRNRKMLRISLSLTLFKYSANIMNIR